MTSNSDILPPRCGEPSPRKGLSHCIRDQNHDDGHVFWGASSTSITYYDQFGNPLVHADLKPGATIEDDEAAALWAYLEIMKEHRAKESKSS